MTAKETEPSSDPDLSTDPNLLDRTDSHRAFWADAVADEIEARDPDDPVVVKGGVSPSGVPHVGHFNEIMRGYYVAEVLRERGHDVRQVFTADDRDRLREVPRTLATLEGEIVDLADERVDAGALGRNLGRPYTAIPDPLGCCDSYGAHFTELLERSAELVGVPVEVVSTTELYESGAFDEIVRHVLDRREAGRTVLANFQDKVDETYVPFQARCERCGKLTDGITAVDADAGTVEYDCVDVEAGGQTIEGCGHHGTASVRDGKLPWRFEWPAQWHALGVDFEPFGKDHAEGSWPSGVEIARTVFDREPPVPMVYEWFTLDGRPLSSSSGTVVTVQEVLELIEVEVFRYFFTKNPRKQRDFSIERLDQLVDEFDRFERLYFEVGDSGEPDPGEPGPGEPDPAEPDPGEPDPAEPDTGEPDPEESNSGGSGRGGSGPGETATGADATGRMETKRDLARRAYPLVMGPDGVREGRVRIPYRFAAVLGMTDDTGLRESMARRSGHIPDEAPDWAVDDALARVPKARAWASRTDNQYNYRLAEELPDVELDDPTRAALADLASFVERSDPDGDDLQGEIYETARRHDIDVGDFFEVGYRLFLDETEGPRLGPFLAELDREFVLDRLRLEA